MTWVLGAVGVTVLHSEFLGLTGFGPPMSIRLLKEETLSPLLQRWENSHRLVEKRNGL